MDGQISRRRFLSGSAAAAGLAVAGMPGLLVPASLAGPPDLDQRWLAARDVVREGRLGRILWSQASFRGAGGLEDAVAGMHTVLGDAAVRVTSYGSGGSLPVFVKLDYKGGHSATLVSSMAGTSSAPAFVRGTSATLWFTMHGLEFCPEGSGPAKMLAVAQGTARPVPGPFRPYVAAVVRAARKSLSENRPVDIDGRWQL